MRFTIGVENERTMKVRLQRVHRAAHARKGHDEMELLPTALTSMRPPWLRTICRQSPSKDRCLRALKASDVRTGYPADAADRDSI